MARRAQYEMSYLVCALCFHCLFFSRGASCTNSKSLSVANIHSACVPPPAAIHGTRGLKSSSRVICLFANCCKRTAAQTGSESDMSDKSVVPVRGASIRRRHDTDIKSGMSEKLSSAAVNTSISADTTGPLNLDGYKSGGHFETTGSYSILVESVCVHINPASMGLPRGHAGLPFPSLPGNNLISNSSNCSQ